VIQGELISTPDDKGSVMNGKQSDMARQSDGEHFPTWYLSVVKLVTNGRRAKSIFFRVNNDRLVNQKLSSACCSNPSPKGVTTGVVIHWIISEESKLFPLEILFLSLVW